MNPADAPAGGVSQADTIGLMAVGGQFGLAGVQAADATLRLAGGLRSPGMLLALAMAGPEGRAVIGDMTELAFLRGTGSTAAAALGLGLDALGLEAAAIRFMLADDGFFTDPILTVPVSTLEGADAEVTRTVTFTLDGDVSFRNAMVAAGATLVVEYLSNGMVRVSVRGNVRGGVDGTRFGLDGVQASAGPLGGVSWLVPNAHEASQLVAALTPPTSAIRAGNVLAGQGSPIPVPQSATVGYTPLSVSASYGQGGTTLVNGSLEATGQVTVDSEGQTIELGLTAAGSSALAGSVLNALPADVQRQLPGEGVWPGGNLAEGSLGSTLTVRTDRDLDVEEVSLSFQGSFGQGTGLSTEVAAAQSTAGERTTVTVTLTREDLEALGPEGRRVLDAFARNRPDQAVQALQALGGEIADHAEVDVSGSEYVSVSGRAAGRGGGTGVSAGGSVTIETVRP